MDIEKINNFDAQKIAYYLALAEQVLGVKLEFQKQSNIQEQDSTIDFMAENRKLRGGGFKNGRPMGNKMS